jgi:hypothetical protein
MKKCKVTLAPKAKQRFFYLAPDAETLYLLATQTVKSKKKSLSMNAILKSHPDIEIVSFSPDQCIEAEWNGCQNFHDEGYETIRINCVRLVKSGRLSPNDEPDSMVSIHFGWMFNDHLRFVNHRRNGMRVKMLGKKDEQFNFDELFPDNLTLEDMLRQDETLDLC